MKPLKIGITGVRGIVGESFPPELVVEFAQAFGTYMDGGLAITASHNPAEWNALKVHWPRRIISRRGFGARDARHLSSRYQNILSR